MQKNEEKRQINLPEWSAHSRSDYWKIRKRIDVKNELIFQERRKKLHELVNKLQNMGLLIEIALIIEEKKTK